MNKIRLFCAVLLVVCLGSLVGLGDALQRPSVSAAESRAQVQGEGFTGSVNCRECHEKFYKLWVLERDPWGKNPEERGPKGQRPEAEHKYRIEPVLGEKGILPGLRQCSKSGASSDAAMAVGSMAIINYF